MRKYDAIIIGSGQGGTPLAKKLAQAGWQTALIEKRWIGGTCINDGCTPTKAMIASAKAVYKANKSKELGVPVTNYAIDITAILNRKNKIVEQFRNSSEQGLLKTENLTLIYGSAVFIDHKKMSVRLNNGSTQELTADNIFIDTGTRTAIPKIEGLDTIEYLTSTSIMELKEIPEHLLIIGASYIGLEFGQMYCRFGSKVTILEHSNRFLSREDEDVAAEIQKIVTAEGINICINSQITKLTLANGAIEASLKMNEEEQTLSCSHVLIAAGRIPNTNDLNLSAAGVAMNERGYINVNDKLETSVSGIYALGDVKGGLEFTHISYNDYIILAKNLLEGGTENKKDRMVPYCMFTDPQLGRVGLTEQQARQMNLNINVAKLSMEHVARAVEMGDTRGMMKAVVDAETKQILGVAIVGAEGGEIMAMLQLAMMGRIPYTTLRSTIFAHPTYGESLNNLFMSLDNL